MSFAQTYINNMTTPTTPQKTMMEVINVLSAHTADVFVKILNILSSKYGHSVDDMLDVIRTHPDYHSICVPPVLTPEYYNKEQTTPKKTRGRPKKTQVEQAEPVVKDNAPPLGEAAASGGLVAPIAVIATLEGDTPRSSNSDERGLTSKTMNVVLEGSPLNSPALIAPAAVIATPLNSVANDTDRVLNATTESSALTVAPLVIKKKVYKIKRITPDTKDIVP